MKNKMRYIVKALVVVFIVASVGGAALLIWLSSPNGEQFVRQRIEQQFSRLLGQTVTIGSLETNLFSRLVVENIAVSSQDGETKLPFIVGRYARIDYNLMHLLKAELTLDAIILKKFKVTAVKDSTGFLNLPASKGAGSNTDSPSPFSLNINLVEISDLSVRFEDRTIPLNGNLSGVDVNIEKQPDGGYGFSLEAESLIAEYHEDIPPVSAIHIEGRLQGEMLSLEEFKADTQGIHMYGNASFNMAHSPFITVGIVHLDGSVNNLRQTADSYVPDGMIGGDGDFSVVVELSTPSDVIELAGYVEVGNVNVHGWAVQKAKLNFSYASNTVTVEDFETSIADGHLRGSGKIGIDESRAYTLEINANKLDISAVLRSAFTKDYGFEGLLSGDVALSGALSHLLNSTAQATLQGSVMGYNGDSLPDIDLALSYKDRALKSTALFNGSTLTAQGEVNSDSVNVTVDGSFTSLELLAALLSQDISGEGKAQCVISGVIKKPLVTCTINAANLHYSNIPVDRLTGGFTFDDSGFSLQDVILSASGINADSLFRALDVADVSGMVSYDASVSGNIRDLNGGISLVISEPGYKQVSLKTGTLKAALHGNSLSIENVSLGNDSLRVNGSAEYAFIDKNGTAQVKFENAVGDSTKDPTWQNAGELIARFDLSDSTHRSLSVQGVDIALSPLAGSLHRNIPVDGALTFFLDVSGTPATPEGRLDITIDKPAYDNLGIKSLNADIRVKPDSLWVSSLNLISQNGEVSGNAGITLHSGNSLISASDRTEGTLSGSDIDLGLIRPLVKGNMKLLGVGSFDLSWNGVLTKPALKGNITVRDGEIGSGKDSIALQNVVVDTRLEDNSIFIDVAKGTISDIPVSVTGEITMDTISGMNINLYGSVSEKEALHFTGNAAVDTLDLKLETANFNLALLQPVTAFFIDLTGEVNSDITVNGALSSPRIDGKITMHDVGFKTPFFNRPLRDGTIAISFQNQTVTVDTLHFNSNGGEVGAGGYFVLEDGGVNDINLSASMHDVKIDQPDKYNFTVDNAVFDYTKTNDNRYDFTGTILIANGTIDYNLNPRSFLPGKKKTRGTAAQEKPSIMKNTRMNIRVSNKNPLLFNNNIAHVNMNSEIEIIGTLEKPNITGRISAEDGYMVYLDRRFEIARGTLDFINTEKINPIINFQAVANIQQVETFAAETYVVTLNVNGAMDEAAIVISSSPSLTKADIVALLTFGVTTDQLTGAKAEGQDNTTGSIMMERVTELSGRIASNYVSRKASSLLGIKGLLITGNLFDNRDNNQLDASEKIQRQFNSDYSVNAGESNNRGIKVRYDVSRYFSIVGYTNQTGQGGVDLEYSVTFK